MLSARELEAVRQIEDVVRLGRVRRIEADRIVLDRGETQTGREALHVDCTALGLNNTPSFNAALIGFVEAHRDDDRDKNRLCRSHAYPSSPEDWPPMMCSTWKAEARWLSEPDLSAWIADSRLNLMRGLPDHAAEPDGAGCCQAISHTRQASDRAVE